VSAHSLHHSIGSHRQEIGLRKLLQWFQTVVRLSIRTSNVQCRCGFRTSDDRRRRPATILRAFHVANAAGETSAAVCATPRDSFDHSVARRLARDLHACFASPGQCLDHASHDIATKRIAHARRGGNGGNRQKRRLPHSHPRRRLCPYDSSIGRITLSFLMSANSACNRADLSDPVVDVSQYWQSHPHRNSNCKRLQHCSLVRVPNRHPVAVSRTTGAVAVSPDSGLGASAMPSGDACTEVQTFQRGRAQQGVGFQILAFRPVLVEQSVRLKSRAVGMTKRYRERRRAYIGGSTPFASGGSNDETVRTFSLCGDTLRLFERARSVSVWKSPVRNRFYSRTTGLPVKESLHHALCTYLALPGRQRMARWNLDSGQRAASSRCCPAGAVGPKLHTESVRHSNPSREGFDVRPDAELQGYVSREGVSEWLTIV
jgi:hypothetical protein